jgi:hypothetical protein
MEMRFKRKGGASKGHRRTAAAILKRNSVTFVQTSAFDVATP